MVEVEAFGWPLDTVRGFNTFTPKNQTFLNTNTIHATAMASAPHSGVP